MPAKLKSTEQPLISVIMPSYNRVAYLQAAVQSVLSQAYSNFELIIVDDCSTDGSWSYLQQLPQQDARIRVQQTPDNTGSPAMPRNIAIELAQADYLAFLDCDDIWHPRKLQRQVPIMRSGEVSLLCSRVEKFTSQEVPADFEFSEIEPIGDIYQSITHDKLLRKNVVATSSVLLCRKTLAGLRFSAAPEDIGVEDYLLWLNFLSLAKQPARLDSEVLVAYRVSPGSLSRSKLQMARRIFALLGRYKVDGKELGWRRYIYFFTYLYGAIFSRMYR